MENKPVDKEAIANLIMDAAISNAIEDKRELLKPSINHFINGGKINGEFDIALKKLMTWVEKKTIEAANTYSSSLLKEIEDGRKRFYIMEQRTKTQSKRIDELTAQLNKSHNVHN